MLLPCQKANGHEAGRRQNKLSDYFKPQRPLLQKMHILFTTQRTDLHQRRPQRLCRRPDSVYMK